MPIDTQTGTLHIPECSEGPATINTDSMMAMMMVVYLYIVAMHRLLLSKSCVGNVTPLDECCYCVLRNIY